MHIHPLLEKTDMTIALDHHTTQAFVDPYAAVSAATRDTTVRRSPGTTSCPLCHENAFVGDYSAKHA